jgi:hypothetical protein
MDSQPAPEVEAPYGTGRRHRTAAVSDSEALARLIADGRVAPDIAVTCWDRVDGIGAQASGVVSAMLLARFAGCRYVHSPFASVGHAIDGRADWARLWERFLNFGDGETGLPEDAQVMRIAAFVRDPAVYAGRKIVIGEPAFGLHPPTAAPMRDVLRGELRAKYWRSPKASIPSHRASRGITAAVHLRRGDVSEARSARRYVPDEVALRQVVRLRRAVAPFGQAATINLYSEGAPEEFRAFAEAGCVLHISENPFESFHNMVTADILMTGRSTFSQVAALLSQGIILHSGGKSPKLSNYLRQHPNGDVPIRRLRRALIERMSWPQWCVYRVRRRWRRWRDDDSRAMRRS